MNTIHHSHSKGQVLVIVSLMLIGLVAVLALVLDGGMLFSNRRSAQLAADAGALAGARAYCLAVHDSPGAATIAAVNAANQYVLLNNADLVNVNIEGGSGDVTVDTAITYDTFFLGILGRAEMTATASATAGCTNPTTGRHILPIAWSCRPPSAGGESDSDTCDLQLMETNGSCDPEAGDPIYMIIDSEKIEGEIVCGNPEESTSGVTYVDCDFDDDDDPDLELLSGGNKSWLNLDGGSGNANELRDWIEEPFDEIIRIHTWFGGTEGTSNVIYQAIEEYLLNEEVIVPVFDQVCPEMPSGDEDNPCHLLWHDEDEGDDIVVESSTMKDYFHIISFASFKITCVDHGGQSNCPGHEMVEESLPPQYQQFFSVEGCFVSGFDPDLGGGGGEVDTGTFIVYLKQ